MKNDASEDDSENPVAELEKQVLSVMEGIRKNPTKKREILIHYVSHVYEAVKGIVMKHGSVVPHYVILADVPELGGHGITDEIIEKAKALGAEAVVSVEGYESNEDMTDIIYHVSMSAPCIGVLGWVFKVKLEEGKIHFVREKPYLFESQDKVKTLGELVRALEEEKEQQRPDRTPTVR